jgi:hypothetical protein
MDRSTIVAWLKRHGPMVVLDVAVNIALPVLIYDRLHGTLGDVKALLASSIPPLLWAVGGFIRNRRVDAIAIIAMAGIALSILAFFGGGSAQFLQLREKMVTLLIGLAFLGSAAIGKPLIYPLARATMARESPDALAEFNAKADLAAVRHTVMVMTLMWGFGLLADFVAGVILIYALPIETYLVVGPVLSYGTIGALALWTILYRRYRTRNVAIASRTDNLPEG